METAFLDFLFCRTSLKSFLNYCYQFIYKYMYCLLFRLNPGVTQTGDD